MWVPIPAQEAELKPRMLMLAPQGEEDDSLRMPQEGIRQCRCEAGDQAELGRLERRFNPCMNECGAKAEAGGHSGREEEDAGARGLRQVREILRDAPSARAMIEGTALAL